MHSTQRTPCLASAKMSVFCQKKFSFLSRSLGQACTTLTRKNMKRFIAILLALSLPTNALAACICLDAPPLHIEITNVYPDPQEGESEWIELKNTGDAEVDLAFYTIEDATAKPMDLEGTLAPGESIQIDELSFQLNNGSDEITLYTIDGEFVHHYSYDSSSSETEEEAISESVQDKPALWPDYSEALPNPEGTDSSEEWIELYNPYTEDLNLEGLKLDDQDGGSSPYSLSGSIKAESYLVISVEDSSLNLNNSTDEVRLLYMDEILWAIPYSEVQEGLSYAFINGDYEWTSPTPGTENKSSVVAGQTSEEVELTEVHPNPEGPDTEDEWIEITNGGDQSIDLGNWTVDDGPGGSDPYLIPEGTIVNPGETLVLDRATSGIALNNSKETVQLIDYTGEVMDEIEYESAQEAQSYSKIKVTETQNEQANSAPLGFRSEIIWEWTEPSPGEPNPVWKEFIGKVVTYDAGMLTLLQGGSEFIFETQNNNFGELLFQPGNTVLVQASTGNGLYKLIRAELLEQVIPNSKSIPWNWISLVILATGVVGYESYKYRQNNQLILPHSKLIGQN